MIVNRNNEFNDGLYLSLYKLDTNKIGYKNIDLKVLSILGIHNTKCYDLIRMKEVHVDQIISHYPTNNLNGDFMQALDNNSILNLDVINFHSEIDNLIVKEDDKYSLLLNLCLDDTFIEYNILKQLFEERLRINPDGSNLSEFAYNYYLNIKDELIQSYFPNSLSIIKPREK